MSELGSLSCSNDMDLNLTMSWTILGADIGKQECVTSKVNSHDQLTDMKSLQKPKNCLPCPRCNSVDTKFCYYNNYNVNQPRHFCKGCQRYWTAGGTLRNVAVGAGKRKRKHASLESEPNTDDAEAESLKLSIKGMGGIMEFTEPPVSSFEAVTSRSPLSPWQAGTSSEKHISKLVGSLHKLCKNGKSENCLFPIEPTAPDLGSNGGNNRSDYSRPRVSAASEMQPSIESGCASSLTTQTGSLEACGQDWKPNAMDSEVTNEGEKGQDVDKTAFLAFHNGALQSAQGAPWMMKVTGGVLNGSSSATLPGPWKGTLDFSNSSVKLPMISAGSTWGPPIDRALSWGPPWGPATTAVDAAKAAMIPRAASSEELPRSVSETRLWVPKTIRFKHPGEAAGSSIWSKLGIGDWQGTSVLKGKL